MLTISKFTNFYRQSSIKLSPCFVHLPGTIVTRHSDLAVSSLSSTLASCPAEDDLSKTPAALTIDQLQHQQQALHWMLWKEEHVSSGGVLGNTIFGGHDCHAIFFY